MNLKDNTENHVDLVADWIIDSYNKLPKDESGFVVFDEDDIVRDTVIVDEELACDVEITKIIYNENTGLLFYNNITDQGLYNENTEIDEHLFWYGLLSQDVVHKVLENLNQMIKKL